MLKSLLWATLASASVIDHTRLHGQDGHIVHERRSARSDHLWVKRDRISDTTTVPVTIVLKNENLATGTQLLSDISDPESRNYGAHLTAKQIHAMFAPKDDSIEYLHQWLNQSGFSASRHSLVHEKERGMTKLHASIAELEELLGTTYHTYTHSETGEERIGCDQYHIPAHLRDHVDFITPTVGMSLYNKSNKSKRSAGSSSASGSIHPIISSKTLVQTKPNLDTCGEAVTPDCIRALYNFGTPTGNRSDNQLGLFENFDSYDQLDLDLFFSKYAPEIPNGTHPILDSINGGLAPIDPDLVWSGESVLDMILIYPLIHPQQIQLYQVDPIDAKAYEGFGDTFLDALDATFCTYKGGDSPLDPHFPITTADGYNGTRMCGTYAPTNVISYSYAVAESSFSKFYEQRQCDEYMKLGLNGVSVIVASGDSGVASTTGCDETTSNSTALAFAPEFPASCPWVTAVGATMLSPGGSLSDPEIAASVPEDEFYSGGGFSNYFPRPSYQNTVVSHFLANHTPSYPASQYNRSGRGIPDVSAIGWNITMFVGGYPLLSGGTSASTPIFASAINLINEERLDAGKKSLGFLNTVLYRHPEVFRDVTSGSNPGCNTDGFHAVEGWDPVTGLGTLDYPKLRDLLFSLP